MRPTRTTQTGPGNSSPIILDSYGRSQIPIQAVVSGTVTDYTVEFTNDNLWDLSITPTWFPSPDPDVVNAGASAASYFVQPPWAIRVKITTGAGSVTLTAISPSLP